MCVCGQSVSGHVKAAQYVRKALRVFGLIEWLKQINLALLLWRQHGGTDDAAQQQLFASESGVVV